MEQPFFLYLAYNAPHTPIQPPEEWVERVRQREPDASEERVRYCALVEHMDHGIGQVLSVLEETGRLEDTLLIYVSDNGGFMTAGADCGPYRGQKGDMYEGGIRVPACAMWGGKIAAGTVSDATAMLMDWLPTVCEVAGVESPPGIDGRSILPTLMGREQPELSERPLYWLRREGGMRFLGLCQHAVRKGRLKLLHNGPFEPLELFDLDADPEENVDLIGRQQDEVQELARLMQRSIGDAGSVGWRPPPATEGRANRIG
jgi:arylsulfatase A-like enzyme